MILSISTPVPRSRPGAPELPSAASRQGNLPEESGHEPGSPKADSPEAGSLSENVPKGGTKEEREPLLPGGHGPPGKEILDEGVKEAHASL